MTHLSKCLTVKEVKTMVNYQHKFATTYLYGSSSSINDDSFVWEINGVDTTIFESYLQHFLAYRPKQYKIVTFDNAGFHSTKNIKIPNTIFLLRIPSYAPELKPCEQVWQYIKNRYKNKRFKDMESLREWLHKTSKKYD
ncbi:MAG: transposase [Polaribacter sp.]